MSLYRPDPASLYPAWLADGVSSIEKATRSTASDTLGGIRPTERRERCATGQDTEMTPIEYFVIMKDFGKLGREAVVNPEDTWNNVCASVLEAAGDNVDVLFVHHIHDNTIEDRTEEAIQYVIQHYSHQGPSIRFNAFCWLERNAPEGIASCFKIER